MLLIRWVHALAAVAWVGGSIFFFWVLRPTYRTLADETSLEAFRATVALRFRELVQACTWAFVITGVLLSFDRLTSGSVGTAYVSLLALKIGLAGWMFYLARALARAETAPRPASSPSPSSSPLRKLSSANLLLVLGVLIILIALVLRGIIEQTIRDSGL